MWVNSQWVKIVVPGTPVPKARARVVGKRAYTPERTKRQEKRIRDHAFVAMQEGRIKKMAGVVRVDIEIVQKGRRGDLDNHAKTCCDAMNNMVYTDDVVIDDLHVWRTIDPDERTIITVSEAIDD